MKKLSVLLLAAAMLLACVSASAEPTFMAVKALLTDTFGEANIASDNTAETCGIKISFKENFALVFGKNDEGRSVYYYWSDIGKTDDSRDKGLSVLIRCLRSFSSLRNSDNQFGVLWQMEDEEDATVIVTPLMAEESVSKLASYMSDPSAAPADGVPGYAASKSAAPAATAAPKQPDNIEVPAPIGVDTSVSIVGYGFASSDNMGNVTDYGYILDGSEAKQANLGTPLFYITFENTASVPAELRLYIRGGKKYNCYWNKTVAVPANSTYTFYGSGMKKAEQYSGAWSVDVRGKQTLRFSLYAN